MTTTTTGAHHSQSQISPTVTGPVQKPSPPPVDILSTPAAQTYAHVHPALLLALYALRFPSMMADPVSEMTTQVPLLAVAQVAYVVTCLPAKGTVGASTGTAAGEGGVEGAERRTVSGTHGPAGTGVVKAGKVGYRRKHHGHKGDGIASRLTSALLSLTLTFLLGTPILAIILVLFGAPLTTHSLHTILCAMHMSLLSSTALIYVYGVDGAVWREVYAFARPADAVWGGALGTGVGAWLGAIPIPLDWDRPWQAYPITILTGAYLGFAIGSLVSRTPLLYGKRLSFTAPEEEQHEKSN
ncbi:Glycosylphosphatidylinositol (GPI) anchor assembly protein [Paecilomyces lecythidis]